MKNLLLVTALIFATTAYSQELRINTVDEFTGSVKMFTKHYKIGKCSLGSLKASIKRVNNYTTIGLYVAAADFGCSGTAKNYVTFLFTDKTTLTLENDFSEIDCADYSESMFNISDDKLATLKTKEISKIRFAQSEGYADFEVAGDYSVKQLLEVVK